eukprot:jgi/Botrbrau1/15296/Bobra.0371s0005.2
MQSHRHKQGGRLSGLRTAYDSGKGFLTGLSWACSCQGCLNVPAPAFPQGSVLGGCSCALAGYQSQAAAVFTSAAYRCLFAESDQPWCSVDQKDCPAAQRHNIHVCSRDSEAVLGVLVMPQNASGTVQAFEQDGTDRVSPGAAVALAVGGVAALLAPIIPCLALSKKAKGAKGWRREGGEAGTMPSPFLCSSPILARLNMRIWEKWREHGRNSLCHAEIGTALNPFPTPLAGDSPAGSAPLEEASQGSTMDQGSPKEMESKETLLRGSSRGALTAEEEARLADYELSPSIVSISTKEDGKPWQLGQGGYGAVFRGTLNGVQPVAIKIIQQMEGGVGANMREVHILKECRSPNVVQFIGYCMVNDDVWLVQEWMERGDLARNITQGELNWYKRGRRVAINIAQGLVLLHSKRILHLDLKSANVLLKADFSAKIADVGLSKVLLRTHCSRVTTVGTFDYAAPELLLGAMQVSEQADIYSFGVILWEIATGQMGKRGQMREVQCPEDCPETIRDLIDDCLNIDPTARPTARQVASRLMLSKSCSFGGQAPPTPVSPTTPKTPFENRGPTFGAFSPRGPLPFGGRISAREATSEATAATGNNSLTARQSPDQEAPHEAVQPPLDRHALHTIPDAGEET